MYHYRDYRVVPVVAYGPRGTQIRFGLESYDEKSEAAARDRAVALVAEDDVLSVVVFGTNGISDAPLYEVYLIRSGSGYVVAYEAW